MDNREKKISVEDYDAYFELALASASHELVNGALEEQSFQEPKDPIPSERSS